MAAERDSPAAYLADRPVLSRRQARWLALAGAAAVSLCGLWLAEISIVGRAENLSIDLRFRARGPRKPPTNIVIAEIDEETRRRLRQDRRAFDLRTRLPEAIRRLWEAGALVVGLDVWLEDLATPEVDAALAQALAEANVVLAVAVSDGKLMRAPEMFLAQDPGEGVITVYPDPGDFVLRRLPPRLSLELDADTARGEFESIPHFPLQLAWFVAAAGGSTEAIRFTGDSAEIGPYWAMAGELVDYASVERKREARELGWTTVKFEDVVGGGFDENAVCDAIVMVGSTRSIEDAFVTSMSDAQTPGVYYHANVLAQILEGRHFDERWSRGWRLRLLTALAAFAAGLFAWNPRQWWTHRRSHLLLAAYVFLGVAFFLCGWCALGHWAFLHRRLLPLAAPLGSMSAALVTGLAFQWIHLTAQARRVEERARRIEMLFGRSVSTSVLEALKRQPELIAHTEVRDVSVLFCDIRGFTALSATMAPTAVAEMLNEYFDYITRAIFENDGFVDKFVGDEVMAVFSAPFEQKDHADRAIRTALAIKRRLADLNRVRQSRGEPALNCGIGIHSGPAAVGHIGSRERSNYTIVGASVNLAARIEKCTEQGEILVSEAVRQQIGPGVQARHWKRVALRGTQGEHDLYEIECPNSC